MTKSNRILMYCFSFAVLCVTVFSFSYMATVAALGKDIVNQDHPIEVKYTLPIEVKSELQHRICLNIVSNSTTDRHFGYLFRLGYPESAIIAESNQYQSLQAVIQWADSLLESQGDTVASTFYYSYP